MEQYYLVLIVVLFALAVSDLVVGVANDAANFLNQAIGSKAAPRWVIFGVACLGVLLGACFSSGMMEIARKGIFHPDMFFFSEIMIIFMTVIIADVVLLDLFNTMGLPTSTTVSLVFELLGAAVAVSIAKIISAGQEMSMLSSYLNSEKALAIMSGILISVVIAFVVGAIIQYITRLAFSFKIENTLKYFGGLFGGISIAVMTYFLIIKGIKDASFVSEETVNVIMTHIPEILLLSFVGWTIILQVLYWLFKIDIPRIVILIGTFGLAMAFAANDLVNFIGVPMAGFQSFLHWRNSGVPADSFSMELLKGEVETPTFMLLVSGMIMVITLIFSKKAKNVIATTVELSRQSEGEERFGSSMLSRMIVRMAININASIKRKVPKRVLTVIDSRFENKLEKAVKKKEKEAPSFDTIRAAVGLVVSGILISLGTSMKLPLSTTYVTFMVAMGTSLADRAWGRDSAVYRISGVFTVIGGWFLTAFVAFLFAFAIAIIISLSGKYGIFVIFGFSVLAIFLIFKTQAMFQKRADAKKSDEEEIIVETDGSEKVIEKVKKQAVNATIVVDSIFTQGIESFLDENRSMLKEAWKQEEVFNKKTRKMKNKVAKVIEVLQQKDSLEIGHHYVQLVDYLRETHRSMNYLLQPLLEHLENNHKPFTISQIDELKVFTGNTSSFLHKTHGLVKEQFDFDVEMITKNRNELIGQLSLIERSQIKRIKNKEVNTRNAVLFFNIISESKNFLTNYVNFIKAQKDFFSQLKVNN